MSNETKEVYCEEIWIAGNQRSAPMLRLDWSNDYHFAFNIRAALTKQELADEFRRIAIDIERNNNI